MKLGITKTRERRLGKKTTGQAPIQTNERASAKAFFEAHIKKHLAWSLLSSRRCCGGQMAAFGNFEADTAYRPNAVRSRIISSSP